MEMGMEVGMEVGMEEWGRGSRYQQFGATNINITVFIFQPQRMLWLQCAMLFPIL